MRCAEVLVSLISALRRAGSGVAAAACCAMLASCGGGNSTETTLIGTGSTASPAGTEVVLSQPQGSNTTEIVVDAGPGSGTGFSSFGVANLPYVTVKVCSPGSATACVTIDHVLLDTGSVGLRVLRSAVAGLNLPAAADATGTLVSCYPFVLGAVWGPLAQADLTIGGETASKLPLQIIDDSQPAVFTAPADCQKAANGSLLNSQGSLLAKGVLGIGMIAYDCGQLCAVGDYTGTYTIYYRCTTASVCTAAAVPAEQQVQNPVVQFSPNSDGTRDDNGTIVMLPAVPDLGAAVVRGRLVFGIGTQTNNQLPLGSSILRVQTDPIRDDYLYVQSSVGGQTYPNSYIDSGSNGYFFDSASLSQACIAAGKGANWYCPSAQQNLNAVITGADGMTRSVSLSIGNADLLFAPPGTNTAFPTLAGAAGAANPGAFVWGLPFFYGKSVYTSIWFQRLSENGPWYTF
jgi:hypothetical protein